MVARGALDFKYEADSSRQGLTSLAGLPVYLDAALDMDATLIATHKRDALFCYKKFKAYQGAMLYSEFRDGNVPARHEQLRVLEDCLPHLPDSVKKVSLRSDTAGYQEELSLYCGEGRDPGFGVIEFAFWRSASRCASWRWATRSNCRFRPRSSAARASTNCSASRPTARVRATA
jgi:hypothetical protein